MVPDRLMRDEVDALRAEVQDLRAGAVAWASLVEDLRHQRGLLEEAQSVAAVGSWELDLRTNVLRWSDEMFRLFGIAKTSSGTSTYDAFLACVHIDDRAALDQAYRASVAERRPYAFQHRTVPSDGRVRIFHERCQTFYAADGAPLRSVGTTQDVTLTAEAEAALYDSREALRAVLDSVPIRVFWKNRDSVYLGCNRPFALDMGFSGPSEVVGKTDYDALWWKSAEDFRADDAAVISSGETKLTYEEPMLRDGRRIWLRTSKVLLLARDGTVSGVLGTYEDISERKELEQRLANAQRLESIGTLAAGIAHEINNPLTYVVANVELAREWLHGAVAELRGYAASGQPSRALGRIITDMDDAVEPLNDAREGAERVARLVADIKSLARIEEASSAPLDLAAVIERAVKMTGNAVRHSARVRTSFGAIPLVEARDGPLLQIFTNLLVNAAQALGEGHADLNEIVISTFTDAGGWANVEIRDTGPGIAPDVLPRIFDPFFTTKPVGAGMGLGLSTCYSIATALGGRLLAASPREGGAVFTLRLPPTQAVASTQPDSPPPDPALTGRILIIDDEPSIARSISRILREHEVTTVTDGREGVALIAAGTAYDLIFCDLMMPCISGIEFYQSILATSAAQASKIVFMTGGAFTAASKAFLEEPGRLHITKPFTTKTIRELAAARFSGPRVLSDSTAMWSKQS
jgi:two-component system cell cycle sensor histidine kinase/response regulator CckA